MNPSSKNYRKLNADDVSQVIGAQYRGDAAPSSGTSDPNADWCGEFERKPDAATDEILCKNCHFLQPDLTCRLSHG